MYFCYTNACDITSFFQKKSFHSQVFSSNVHEYLYHSDSEGVGKVNDRREILLRSKC
jgi:hypothetical protein